MISPGAISPVGLAWASVQAAVGAIRAMPVLVGTAFLGLLAWAALKTALGLDPNTLHSVMGAAVDTIVTASVVVGVCRWIVLDETVDRPVWLLPPQYDRLLAYALAISGLVITAIVLAGVIGLVAGFFILVRTLLILPAVATDAPGAGWAMGSALVRGRSLRLFAAVLLVEIPLTILSAIAESAPVVAAGFLGAGVSMIESLVSTAVAALAYRAVTRAK